VSLAERAKDYSQPPLCLTCLWYDQLSGTEKEAFDQLAAREDVYKRDLLDMCAEEGLQCSETSFRRHMRNCRRGTR
jgi:hypothetical protein